MDQQGRVEVDLLYGNFSRAVSYLDIVIAM